MKVTRVLVLAAAIVTPALAVAQTGGPDASGNVFAPSAYDFVPLDGTAGITGTALTLAVNGQADVALPWSFPFYGGGYNAVSVSANGALRFQTGAIVAGTNQPVPSSTGAIPDVAVFWDYLDPTAGGAVRWYDDAAGGRFIVSWEGVPHFGGIGAISVQVHLYPDGGMRLHWEDTSFGNSIYDGGASATVGIQDVVGGTWAAGNALQYSFDAANIASGTSAYIGACGGDVDSDGFVAASCGAGGLDCDDYDAAISPLATEVCDDGLDQDCDGADLPSDVDGDGALATACGGDDCDDAAASVGPTIAEVCGDGIDNDCAAGTLDLFDSDGDGSDCATDCDDGDAAFAPGLAEICDDGLDQDCDGADLVGDADADSYPSVACGGTDCDDASAAVNPGIDADGDGFDACADCDETDALVFPGGDEFCDSVDTDCDGLDDSVDVDINSSASVTNSYPDSTGLSVGGFGTSATTFTIDQTVGASAGPIVDLDIYLSIIHSAPGTLEISLTSPSGTTVLLTSLNGGLGVGFGNPTFDDEAATPVSSVGAPFFGTLQPDGLLSDIDGEEANGVWTLTVVDTVPATDDGTLTFWQLNITTQAGDDADSDGYVDSCGDCGPNDPSINLGASEICGDGVDQDCDGSDLPSDADGDGFDDVSCGGADCDDGSAAVNPSSSEVCNDNVDNDCDAGTLDLFDGDGDGSDCAVDCDDGNAFVGPGAAEVCADGIDNDCDAGTLDLFDGDGDGVDCSTDCDDGDATVLPGAVEALCTGVDEDCDAATSDLGDADGDGVACDTDCDDADPFTYPGAPEFVCDGVDQACDGIGSEVDVDGDGVPQCQADCDDTDATIYPGAPELCGDGVDQDCDGSVDESADGAYSLGDDDAVTFELCSFSFPFCGQSFDAVTLQSNGRLTFGDAGGLGFDDGSGADSTSAGSVSDLLGEVPQIAFFWGDLDPGFGGSISVLEDDGAGTFVVTFSGISQSPSWGSGSAGPNTVTVTLSSIGVASLDYDFLSADVALIGWACGAAGTVTEVDLSDPAQPVTAPRIGSGTEDALYQHFVGAANGGDDLDLQDSTLQLCLTGGVDDDGDGWTDLCGDCEDNDVTIYPGAPELCDGYDHDCDTVTDDADDDGDGYVSAACGGPDCDDDEPTVNPAQTEACDGLDNDCDGFPETGGEDNDADGWLVCGGDCDDGDAAVNPDGVEICNEVDDDCDGDVDEGWNRDNDADGTLNPDCGGDDCDDFDSDVSPITVEWCDEKDNDCSGVIDDVDVDGDGFFSDECGGDDCNDLRAATWPGAPEECDGTDTDCNGFDNDVDLDGDGGIDANCGGDDCHDGDPTINRAAAEVCDDGVDNDCNGGTDQGGGDLVADPECTGCQCESTVAGSADVPALWLFPPLLLVRRRR